MCEPLDTITVCQALNDSDVLCAPSGWAGDAIKDAVNATVVAMRQLDRTLHFQVGVLCVRMRVCFSATSSLCRLTLLS